MLIPFCYVVIAAVACVAVYLLGSVLWHTLPVDISAPDLDDEEFPEDPDRSRDWAVADEMGVL